MQNALRRSNSTASASPGRLLVLGFMAITLVASAGLPFSYVRATEASGSDFVYVINDENQDAVTAFQERHELFIDETFADYLTFLGAEPLGTPIEIAFVQPVSANDPAEPSTLADANAAITFDSTDSTINVVLSRFDSLTEVVMQNQIRHALALAAIDHASSGMVPVGFAEGFALYAERSNDPVVARRSAIVQSAYDLDGLVSWFNANRIDPGIDQELSAAESFAIVSFLIRQYGLPEFQHFVREMATAESWRDAMTIAYDPATADTLERQWREQLPAWFAGDWKWNLMAGFDFAPARRYLESGNFAAAENALLVSEQLLRDIDSPDLQRELEILQAQAYAGGLAEEKMRETQQALENFAYERADAALIQAIAQFETLPEKVRPSDTIAQYQELIAVGMQAESDLNRSRILAGDWMNYPEARSAAVASGNGYATLGDATMLAEAQTLVNQLDLQRRRLVLLFGALTLLSFVWLFVWLRSRGRTELNWGK